MTTDERLDRLEEQLKEITKGYLRALDLFANTSVVNGEKYHNLIDLTESLETRFQVLLELLGQDGVVNLEEFRKYQKTIHRMAKKRRLERSFQKETDE